MWRDACACFGTDKTCDESCLDRTGLAPGDADRACARCGVTPSVALIEAVKRAEAAENDAHDWMDRAVRAESELAEARAMHEGARIRYRYAEGLLDQRETIQTGEVRRVREANDTLRYLLDAFDRYASIEGGPAYAGSPFQRQVQEALNG